MFAASDSPQEDGYCKALLGSGKTRLWWTAAIKANLRESRAWYFGLPGTWWWGLSADAALNAIKNTCDRSITTIRVTAEQPRPRPHKIRTRAMCIVGGLRTFSMPAVHTNLARVAREWEADVFANVHNWEDFTAEPKQYVVRANKTCGNDPMPPLLAMHPVHVELNERTTQCVNTAAVQYTQIRSCLSTALAHRRYELLARVRPDFYFSPTFPLSLPTSSVSDAAPALAWAIGAFNMDALFVLTAAAAEEFIATPRTISGRRMEFPECGGGNNLDTDYPLFRDALPPPAQRPLRIPWRTVINQSISHVWGGLMRSTRIVRATTDVDWARLKADMEAHRRQFRCGDGAAAEDEPFRIYNHAFANDGKGDLF